MMYTAYAHLRAGPTRLWHMHMHMPHVTCVLIMHGSWP